MNYFLAAQILCSFRLQELPFQSVENIESTLNIYKKDVISKFMDLLSTNFPDNFDSSNLSY